MNVRNISQYITKLCGKESLELLGSNKEPLLQKIYGQDPSHDQVKAVISDAASFASNAEEQLFYEFVQNAYDANADSLFSMPTSNISLCSIMANRFIPTLTYSSLRRFETDSYTISWQRASR